MQARMIRRSGVTIEDVAAAVGVSRQTVSRVLNDSPNVKPAVRARIDAAIEALGYVPNLSARRMGGGRSYVVLAINDRARTIENWQARRGNDYVDQMLHGGMTACEAHGWHLVFELVDTEPALARRRLANALASLRPDGVILTPPHCDNADLVALLAERGIPCARIGHRDGTATVDVFMDEAGAARAATRHLIALGHRRIAFIAGAANYGGSALRVGGYRAALAEAGIAEAMVGDGDFHFETAERVIAAWLSAAAPPTAVIADNDEMAFAALHMASARGLRVPEDLAVVSFEDTPGVRFAVPPLTAIRQPVSEMIAEACNRLIAMVEGKDGAARNDGPGRHEIPFELVVRASTGPGAG
jgi:LacI family transcriptional regulator